MHFVSLSREGERSVRRVSGDGLVSVHTCVHFRSEPGWTDLVLGLR